MRTLLFSVLLGAVSAVSAHATQISVQYNASLMNVVLLGQVNLRAQIGAAGYSAAATVSTAGFARLFDDTRINAAAAGRLGRSGLDWMSYDLSHAYGKKFRRVSMRRTGQGISTTIAPTFRDWGHPPASSAQQMAARDPVSSVMELSRSVGASGKCSGAYPTFDGRGYYLLVLSPKFGGRYQGGGYAGGAIVCTLRYQPVAGFPPMSAAERARIPAAEVWFATPAHGYALPLRVEVPTPLGPARLDLARYTLS